MPCPYQAILQGVLGKETCDLAGRDTGFLLCPFFNIVIHHACRLLARRIQCMFFPMFFFFFEEA